MRSPSRAGHRPDPSVSPRTTMLTPDGQAQSYANPSQRRFHTGNCGNPLFSPLSFSQNGEFKSKGFRFPCVLSVGFRAM